MKVVTLEGRVKQSPGLPVGTIMPIYDSIVPSGWALCDGTGGTPDLRDRIVIGGSAIGLGSASGSTSPAAALSHASATVDNHDDHIVTEAATHSAHGVTQPATHSAHGVTQPSAHSTHAIDDTTDGAHSHDSHSTQAVTAGGVSSPMVTGPIAHSRVGAHAHDAHSAHSGMTVSAHAAHANATVSAHAAHSTTVNAHPAHSINQASNHSIIKFYTLAFCKKVTP